MLNRLLTFVAKYLLDKLFAFGSYLYKNYIDKKKLEEAMKDYKEAGTSPGLTPEQQAKEQEDAFDKLIGANKRP